MKFQKNSRRKPLEYEKDLILRWKKNKTFEKSVDQRSKDDPYVFYDGPPFITGVPHHGTLLPSVAKDVVPRFWTMKGKRVERTWGWDCHGLPAEVFTEKKLGIKDKRDIGTKISLEEYINTCRTNMVQTGSEWEDTIDRIGRWVDFNGAYKTMDKDYMESVWWAFKELYDKKKIYEGERVLMYCTRDATPLSKAEIAMDNSYSDDTDPSVFVKFKLNETEETKDKSEKLKDQNQRYLLAWTTTPWTLPSNSAIAVNRNVEYAEVKVDGEVFVLAKALIETALTDEKHKIVEHEVLRTFAGEELVGKKYEPLFEPEESLASNDKAFTIWHADFVTDEQGTGIAHESPAYGEEDYALSQQYGFPWVISTDENGFFTMGGWKGQNVWEVNKQIAKDLKEQGKVWKIEYITHSYPHCFRCDTKLMYRAHPSWFMDIDGQRDDMLEANQDIHWHPEHLKNGRFAKTVESAPDWNLSRDRFWATPMPVWRSEDGDIKVVGSYDELEELSGRRLDDYHRPWVDDITFEIGGKTYTRIEKVMDCWFESGSMPFAQFHYPFENKEKFEASFPGDFIVEYMGQVRAWFYYMHAVSIGLFGKKAYRNVITTGTIAGNDGRKMSKSFGNYTDPIELADEYSADALRFLYMSSPLMNGGDYSLLDKDVSDIHRKLQMIWNMYDFFTLYADVDNWEFSTDVAVDQPSGESGSNQSAAILPIDPSTNLANPLDLWIVSRVHQLNKSIDEHMQRYDIPNAMKPILEFVDDASNWYVRRSRKRFWKSEDDSDKFDAYKTLHYVLVHLSQIMAPFTPFLAEELYQKLTGGESVHLLDWPQVGAIDEELTRVMGEVRVSVSEGLAARSRAQLKARQPLASVTVHSPEQKFMDYSDIVAEELNVKKVLFNESPEFNVELDTNITDELRIEGVSRELIRHIQSLRKTSELEVSDRIHLSVQSDDQDVQKALEQFGDEIRRETLADTLDTTSEYGSQTAIKLNKAEATISLQTV